MDCRREQQSSAKKHPDFISREFLLSIVRSDNAGTFLLFDIFSPSSYPSYSSTLGGYHPFIMLHVRQQKKPHNQHHNTFLSVEKIQLQLFLRYVVLYNDNPPIIITIIIIMCVCVCGAGCGGFFC